MSQTNTNNEDFVDSARATYRKYEGLVRGVGGAFSQVGTVCSITARHLALGRFRFDKELAYMEIEAELGESKIEPTAVLNAAAVSLSKAITAVTSELAEQRAHTFVRIVDLLSVGRGRAEVREFLAGRLWRSDDSPSGVDIVVRELIETTPGMESFIRSQVEIPGLWSDPTPTEELPKAKRGRGRGRARARKQDAED